jgi:hypothetical protein
MNKLSVLRSVVVSRYRLELEGAPALCGDDQSPPGSGTAAGL